MLHDRAAQLSVDYLSAIQNRLRVEWDGGTPVSLPDEWNTFTFDLLRADIADLFRGETLRNAVIDARDCGRHYVQGAAFGLTQDFDAMVRLGFLLGHRIILWDYLYSRVLSDREVCLQTPELVAEVAHHLLLARELVERGVLVVLPHPLEWCEDTQRDLAQLASEGRLTADTFPLAATLSVTPEIPLHPYTLFPPPEVMRVEENRYTSTDYAEQAVLSTFFFDERMAFIRDRPLAEYHEQVARDAALLVSVRRYIDAGNAGHTPQQVAEHAKVLRAELLAEIAKRNDALQAAEVGTALAWVGSACALIPAVNTGEAWPAVTAVLAFAGALGQYVSAVLAKTGNSVLVRAFRQLQQS